jgi:hypothetical protein
LRSEPRSAHRGPFAATSSAPAGGIPKGFILGTTVRSRVEEPLRTRPRSRRSPACSGGHRGRVGEARRSRSTRRRGEPTAGTGSSFRAPHDRVLLAALCRRLPRGPVGRPPRHPIDLAALASQAGREEVDLPQPNASAGASTSTTRLPAAARSRLTNTATAGQRHTAEHPTSAKLHLHGARRAAQSVQRPRPDRRRARLAFAARQPAPLPGRRPWRPPARRRPPGCARAADSVLPQDTSSSTRVSGGVRRHRRHIRVGGRCGRRPWRCWRRSGRGHRRRERVRQRRQRLRRVRGRHGRAPFARSGDLDEHRPSASATDKAADALAPPGAVCSRRSLPPVDPYREGRANSWRGAPGGSRLAAVQPDGGRREYEQDSRAPCDRFPGLARGRSAEGERSHR